MKLTHFKIIPLIVAGATLLIMSGCDGTTGISSDSGIAAPATPPATPPVTPSGTAPVAVDDTKNITVIGAINQAASVDVLANDTDAENDINASSIQIVGTTNPGDPLVVANEGTWSVTNVNNIRFTPETDFIGDPTPIRYTVSDDTGLVSNEANVTIDYTQTYFENTTAYPIPDATGTPNSMGISGQVTSEINVSNAVTSISNVTVTVDINHTFVGDLQIRLVSPSATSIILKDFDNTENGDNLTNTTFDDAAATPITSGSVPYTGTFSPVEPLATFNTEDANGIWSLEVEDNWVNDDGNISSWSITIN